VRSFCTCDRERPTPARPRSLLTFNSTLARAPRHSTSPKSSLARKRPPPMSCPPLLDSLVEQEVLPRKPVKLQAHRLLTIVRSRISLSLPPFQPLILPLSFSLLAHHFSRRCSSTDRDPSRRLQRLGRLCEQPRQRALHFSAKGPPRTCRLRRSRHDDLPPSWRGRRSSRSKRCHSLGPMALAYSGLSDGSGHPDRVRSRCQRKASPSLSLLFFQSS
jgi:hypothetical protein